MGFGERNCLSQMKSINSRTKRTSFSLPQCFWYFLHKKVHNLSKKLLLMDLKQFVKTALIQIDEALEETTKNSTKHFYTYWKNISWNETIDFEVQVYASDEWWVSGGLWINVAWINIWTKWEIANKNHEQSTIKFNVLRKNTPEQEVIERDSWNSKMNLTSFNSYDENQPY